MTNCPQATESPFTGASSRCGKRPALFGRTRLFFLLFSLYSVAAGDWVQECRTAGFDPEQLACRTCTILPEAVQQTCQKCCTPWLGEEMLRKPYQAAVLIDRANGSGEVAGFLQEGEWDNVVQAKGANRLKHIVDDSSPSARELGNIFYAGAFRKPSMLLFFDSTAEISRSASSSSDVKKLMAAAKESISLDGLEKADLKDMLMTLLP